MRACFITDSTATTTHFKLERNTSYEEVAKSPVIRFIRPFVCDLSHRVCQRRRECFRGKNASREAYLEEISRSFGGVEILDCSDLDIDDPNFWVEFYDPNHHSPAIDIENPNPDPYYIPYDKKLDLPQPLTTANTKYNVYTSSNSLKAQNVVSVFDAIDRAQNVGDKVIETDTGTTVFTNDGSESTFYAFQFTNFYKILYSAEAANNWVRDFAYAHVVNGKGKLTHNSYRSLKGVPDVVALEPEHGGYYYKYSYPTATHFASSNTVVLSNTNVKYSSNNFVENAYVYSAVVNQNGATEFGLISCAERNGKWYAYSSVNKNIHLSTNPIILPTQNASGVFTTNATVEIQLYLSGKTIMGRIVSGSNVLAESGSLSLKGYNSKGSSVMFLQACSLVRDTENITFDLRDGSYFQKHFVHQLQTLW